MAKFAGKAPERKIKAYRRGRLAEYQAAILLLFKGHRLLAMRYRTKSGEIDLIMRKGDLVIFVEVKARGTVEAALAAVTFEARRRIHAASLAWISRQADAQHISWRYDLVAVTPWRLPQHFPGAF